MAFSLDTDNPYWESDPHSSNRLYTMRDKDGVTHILSETTSERDLGVIIDNIDHAAAKASSAYGNIKRSFKYWTPSIF